MNRRIAIVEDEVAIRENFRDALVRQGYDVDLYGNRRQALEAFQQRLPELVIIDVGLEDEPEGGFDLCRQLRAQAPRLPIIFLTARDSELDIVSGLRLGADDYLTKEISLDHLVARVVALFRRVEAFSEPTGGDTLLQRGKLVIDPDRMTATWDGQPVELTVTEFWMVHSLARHPGHVKSRQQLMDAASVVYDEHTITSHIKRIRRKFLAIDSGFDAIETAYGAGYRWKAR
ncbi:MAG: proteobacterial dedicated sortase system response regulator [Gammaproteobacteria bacterium]